MHPTDDRITGDRKPWVKPVVIADKAVHAEGSTPRSFNHDGAIVCSS